ncbi:MAG: hypothetical protein AAF731_06115 [Bacteroidota bacterium]
MTKKDRVEAFYRYVEEREALEESFKDYPEFAAQYDKLRYKWHQLSEAEQLAILYSVQELKNRKDKT